MFLTQHDSATRRDDVMNYVPMDGVSCMSHTQHRRRQVRVGARILLLAAAHYGTFVLPGLIPVSGDFGGLCA